MSRGKFPPLTSNGITVQESDRHSNRLLFDVLGVGSGILVRVSDKRDGDLVCVHCVLYLAIHSVMSSFISAPQIRHQQVPM